MAKNKINNKNQKINWLQFFQFLNSKNGRIMAITSLVGIGFTVGIQAEKFIKDRELAQMESRYSDLNTTKNILLIRIETTKSVHQKEVMELTTELKRIKDSIKHGKDK